MRTTLDIAEDVLVAAKEIASQEGTTAGKVISDLARRGLSGGAKPNRRTKGGIPLLASRGEVVTLESVRRIMDQEGI